MSPGSHSASTEASDPLVVEMAQRIAHVINDFKRKLDKRDMDWANVRGQIELELELQDYTLTVEPDELGDEYPVTVTARVKADEVTNGNARSGSTNASSVRSSSPGTQLERNAVSRKKRGLDEDGDISRKRRRTGDELEDMISLITKEDLDSLFKLHNDKQDDTLRCVNHLGRLLRRIEQERHQQTDLDREKSPDHDQSQNRSPSTPADNIAFPPPSVDRDSTATASLTDVVRREAKLLSSQIKWVEDCRRVAFDAQDKREDTWRMSSAGFHDRARQNREDFQNTILQQQGLQGQKLQQILNEVQTIGLYVQSNKWEVPGRGMAMEHPSPVAPPPPFAGVGTPQTSSWLAKQMSTYSGGTPNGAGKGGENGTRPPFPR